MKELAIDSIDFASSYLKTMQNMFERKDRRFDNDLLYNMISISFEKFMVGYLAHFDQIANSHLPVLLFKEVRMVDSEFDEKYKQTAILIGKFEGICSIEDFGYRTPSDDEVSAMIKGLKELESYVNSKMN